MPREKDVDFLRTFFRLYVPPFTQPILQTKEKYEKVYLSSQEIWWHLHQMIDRVPLPFEIKKKMVELFAISKEVWIHYLVADGKPFFHFKTNREVQDKWKKMQKLADQIMSYVRKTPELEEPLPFNI